MEQQQETEDLVLVANVCNPSTWKAAADLGFVFKFICFMCLSVLSACAWCLQSLKESVQCPGTVVTDGYESLCGSWELNPGVGYPGD